MNTIYEEIGKCNKKGKDHYEVSPNFPHNPKNPIIVV